jgi:hypothetical protein
MYPLLACSLLAALIGTILPNQGVQSKSSPSDLCHVYVVEVEQAEKLMNELDSLGNPTESQALTLKKKYPNAERILGQFETQVGEEILTTKHYQIPGTKYFVTASVYYTDEMMRSSGYSDSMNVAIVVSPQKYKDAMTVMHNSTSQISYNGDTDKVQVKTKLRINRRVMIVGVECQARVKTLHPALEK